MNRDFESSHTKPSCSILNVYMYVCSCVRVRHVAEGPDEAHSSSAVKRILGFVA